jgi:hypothetical protein
MVVYPRSMRAFHGDGKSERAFTFPSGTKERSWRLKKVLATHRQSHCLATRGH